jgi:hypothetical protein
MHTLLAHERLDEFYSYSALNNLFRVGYLFHDEYKYSSSKNMGPSNGYQKNKMAILSKKLTISIEIH